MKTLTHTLKTLFFIYSCFACIAAFFMAAPFFLLGDSAGNSVILLILALFGFGWIFTYSTKR